jgi:hypothetical protein
VSSRPISTGESLILHEGHRGGFNEVDACRIDPSHGPAGYALFLGCVSGPQEGAMGFHYVNGDLVGDGVIDAQRPEALIY